MGKSKEYRCFGPPGTGKTTWLSKQVRNAVDKHGEDSVVLSSFTKAAASNLAGRDLPIPEGQIGTLHALCYRILSRPTLAQSKVKDFNEEYPMYSLTKTGGNLDEGTVDVQAGKGRGDALMAEYKIARNRLRSREVWPKSLLAFAAKWEDFKKQTGTVDFDDLIELTMSETLFAPNNARIGFFDEAQDFSALQLKLVRWWGGFLDYFVLVGDDDQCIYEFTGATPDSFLTPEIDESRKIFRRQSYRVPVVVQAHAQKYIERVSHREPKNYKPRMYQGEIRRLGETFRYPAPILADALKYVNQGKTVMFLTSCSYMLTPLISELKARGIPYHNPYRLNRGDWNPLRWDSKRRTAASKLEAYLSPNGPRSGGITLWTAQELVAWASICPAKRLFRHGGKKALEDLAQKEEVTLDEILDFYAHYFREGALDAAVDLDLGWLQRESSPSEWKPMQFPAKICSVHGARHLRKQPRIIVGTIHSVKGGEADVVYLFPDISPEAAADAVQQRGKDAIIRQYYVGMTRCRESLIICDYATPFVAEGVLDV